MQIITYTLANLTSLKLERQFTNQIRALYLEMRRQEESGELAPCEKSTLLQNMPLLEMLRGYFAINYPCTAAILGKQQRDYNFARFLMFLDQMTMEDVQKALKEKIDEFPAHEVMGLFV